MRKLLPHQHFSSFHVESLQKPHFLRSQHRRQTLDDAVSRHNSYTPRLGYRRLWSPQWRPSNSCRPPGWNVRTMLLGLAQRFVSSFAPAAFPLHERFLLSSATPTWHRANNRSSRCYLIRFRFSSLIRSASSLRRSFSLLFLILARLAHGADIARPIACRPGIR